MLKLQRRVELLIAFAIFFGVLTLTSAEDEQAALASKLIRLHVVAESDSDADQAHKLEIRDRILEDLAPILSGVTERADALARISNALPALSEKYGGVTFSLRREHFPERQYETFKLPAGEYTALRAVIGSGAGRNWWCVVFPQLCVEAVTTEVERDSSDAFALLSEDEVRLITGSDKGYVVKFKALELLESLRALFK
ncbi:MAG: stage II sporulation protein R [Oscillospiraceae bacterium]|jgi:stage II sporulation protein R|nr:stage II sporulation protein R [Oscillospiraceae bacterium]